MKNHGLKLGLCLAVTLFAFGCSDDDSSDNKKPTGCTATVCSGDSLIVCNADGTTTTQACANGCDAATNQCKADSGNQGGNEGGEQGGNEGGDQGGNEGGEQGGNEGGEQGGNEGGEQGGNEGGEQGGEQGGNEGGEQGGAIVDANIHPVPESQDNTVGAECDEEEFVEHCDGDKVVQCGDDGVEHVNCADSSLHCAVRLIGDDEASYNAAGCYESCTKAGEKKKVCSKQAWDGAELLVDVICSNTSKGLLLMEDEDGGKASCANVCQNGSCETNKSCGEVTYSGKCDGDKFVYCDTSYTVGEEMSKEVLYVIDCAAKGLTCSVDSRCQ